MMPTLSLMVRPWRNFHLVLMSLFILFSASDGMAGNHKGGNSSSPTATFNVYLESSASALLGGGVLRFHDGSWHTVPESPAGTFTITTAVANVVLEMTYNNGKQTVNHGTGSNFTFQTVETTLAIKDPGGTPLPGGTGRYHQIGWVNWSNANTTRELLPGTYTMEATYNNGKQTKVFAVPQATSYEALFTTVPVTMALKDAGNNALSGGTGRFHQVGWVNWGSLNTTMELLPGTYTMEACFNNGKQTKVVVIPQTATYEALFTTVSTTMALKDCSSNALSGGTGKFHQIGWVSWGSLNTSLELLPGTYTMEATYNNGRQTKVVAIPQTATYEALFTTVLTTMALKNFGGGTLSGGTGKFHQIGWVSWGSLNTALELLPGTYTMEATYNNGRQTKVIAVTGSPCAKEALFTTVATTVNLGNCTTGLAGGTVNYHQIGWTAFGTTNAMGNAVLELLPGTFTFEMSYNGGKKTKVQAIPAGPAALVEFDATLVKLQFSGTIMYHQNGWNTFDQPSENLLEGTYTFKFDSYSVGGVVISGCTKTQSIVIFKMQKCNGTGVAGGTADALVGGVWQSASATDGNGHLLAWYNGTLTGSSRFRMFYNSHYSADYYQNVATNSYVTFNLAEVAIRAFDGTNAVAQADGGALASVKLLYNGNWVNLSPNTNLAANGVLMTCMFPGSRRLLMSGYNYSSLDMTFNVTGCNYNADFPTVKNAVQVEDQSNTLLSAGDPNATLHILDNGIWNALGSDLSTDGNLNGVFKVAVLAGSRRFLMTLNGTTTDQTFTLAIAQPVATFDAIRNPVKWADQCGNGGSGADPNATAHILYNGNWFFLGEDDDDGTLNGVVAKNGVTNENSVILAGSRRFLMYMNGGTIDQTFSLTHAGTTQACFSAVRNPVEFRDQFGALLPDSEGIPTVHILYNGNWFPLGNTSNGVLQTVVLAGSRRFLGSLNYTTTDQTFNVQQTGGAGLCNANVAVFQAVKDAVRLTNGCDEGIAGGLAKILYNGNWQTLGTTDASGIVKNKSLLAGSRRFLMTLPSGASQDKTFSISWAPVYAQFNASNVSFHFCGTKQYKNHLNQWINLTNPTAFFHGSQQFRFNGNLTTIDLTGDCNINQTVVIYNLKNSAGGPQAGGKAQMYNGSWIEADGQTDAAGKLIAVFNGNLLGNRSLRMTYEVTPGFNSVSGTVNYNIGSTCDIMFQLTGANFRTWNGSSVVTEVDGGDPDAIVSVYNGSNYVQLGVLGSDGQLAVDMFSATLSFRCSNYNYTSQAFSQNLGASTNVNFGTRENAIELRDENGNLVTSTNGQAFIYDGANYQSLGATSGGIVDVALLHGTWSFRMNLNYTSQAKAVNITSGPAVMNARIMPAKVEDENDDPISGVAVSIYDGAVFQPIGTTDGNGEISQVLMYGTWTFKGAINYTSQNKAFNIATGPVILDARSIPVRVEDENDAPISGVAVSIYDGAAFQSMGTTDGNGEISQVLMFGTWTFKGAINYTSQNKAFNISAGPVILDARSMPVKVEDENDAPISGVAVSIYDGAVFQPMGTTDGNGEISQVLMFGTWTFKGAINYSTQSKNVNISGAPAILDARTDAVRLEDGSSAPLAGGMGYVWDGSSYQLLGATDGTGYIPNKPLMFSTLTFKMEYAALSDVKAKNISTGAVIFIYDGVEIRDNGQQAELAEPAVVLSGMEIYPNPATEFVIVGLEVFSDTRIDLGVYDAKGTFVKRLYDGEILKGEHQFRLNRDDLTGGMYIIRLAGPYGMDSKQVIFMD